MYSFKKFLLTEKNFQDITKGEKNRWFEISVNDLDPATDINKELFNLIDKSYAYLINKETGKGGHIGFSKPEDIPYGKIPDPSDVILWYANDIDDDPEADITYAFKQTPYGKKGVVSATDGSSKSKLIYLQKMAERLKTNGNYGEVSGAIAHILMSKFGIQSVDDKEKVEKIIGKKVTWFGSLSNPFGNGKDYPDHNGFYERELGGEKHVKIMLGKPLI